MYRYQILTVSRIDRKKLRERDRGMKKGNMKKQVLRCVAQMVHQNMQAFGDFRCAELDSVMEMNGIDPREAYDR